MFNLYQSNIPTDIQLLLNNNEVGMILLRLVEIIGEDDLENLDPDSLYFMTSILNNLNLDTIRNKLLLKVLLRIMSYMNFILKKTVIWL